MADSLNADLQTMRKCTRCYKTKHLNECYTMNPKKHIHWRTCDDCRHRFKCTLCKYICSKNSSLQDHIRSIHSKIKDIECLQCDYRTNRKSHLKTHVLNIHTNGKTYTCVGCYTVYNTEIKLTNHMKKNHNCAFCTDIFVCMKACKKHMKELHSKCKVS